MHEDHHRPSGGALNHHLMQMRTEPEEHKVGCIMPEIGSIARPAGRSRPV